MDVISHGLWGGLAFGRKTKKDYWLGFSFGVAPDVLSFGILTIVQILGLRPAIDWESGPVAAAIPDYVYQFYNITHSLIIFAAVFGIIWLIRKKPYLPLLAWGFHVLLDIFTHSTQFFATPFLWPLSNFKFNGTPWSHPEIFFPNWALLIIGYIIWRRYTKRK